MANLKHPGAEYKNEEIKHNTLGEVIKKCAKCKKELTLNNFYSTKNGEYSVYSYCRKCSAEIQNKKYHLKHPNSPYHNEDPKYNNKGEMVKICDKCKTEKIFKDFSKSKESKFGILNICKNCRSNKRIEEYHINNPDTYYIKNKEVEQDGKTTRICTYHGHEGNQEISLKEFKFKKGKPQSWCKKCENKEHRNYAREHRKEILAKRKEKREKIEEKLKRKEYDIKRRPIDRLRINTRRKNDVLFKLKCNLRSRLRAVFRTASKHSKPKHTIELIGITWEELRIYLESKFKDGMNWNNYGYYGWHIDHIIPLASAKTEEEMIKLCHYTNLQPLWWKDNISKGDKMPTDINVD